MKIADLRQEAIRLTSRAIAADNPCKRLAFINEETGDEIQVPCDTKHCKDCGPRKRKLLVSQIRTGFGDYAYTQTFTTRKDLDRTIERVRKAAHRSGATHLYQSVGSEYLGWILISTQPLAEGQNRSAIKDYIDRICDYWKRGDRIRRSMKLGRLSRLSYRTVEEVGTSPWKRLVQSMKTRRELRLEAEIANRDALIADIGGWHVWEENGRWVSPISAWRVDHER